jgi:hypothetical protein
VEVLDLYTAADRYNATAIGGFTATVGAAGGFVLGGGTGPLGRVFGLGVDSTSASRGPGRLWHADPLPQMSCNSQLSLRMVR